MPFHILVVDANATSRAAVERLLGASGHFVTYLADFEEAKQRLQYALPDLLIAAVKLGSFNGLHLALRAHSADPSAAAIVVHTEFDPVLANEARNVGATFVTTPVDEKEFLGLVERLLAQTTQRRSAAVPRRWPRKQVAVPATIGGNDAKVVDVSYGGLRVEIDGIDEPLARLGTIEIPNMGPLPVHPVWARGGGISGTWWCGAEVDMTDEDASDAWRRFVDSLH
jgi:DNA-binding response OmpR family regulator